MCVRVSLCLSVCLCVLVCESFLLSLDTRPHSSFFCQINSWKYFPLLHDIILTLAQIGRGERLFHLNIKFDLLIDQQHITTGN